MVITWCGTASLRIDAAQGSLLIDPFGQMPLGKKAEQESIRRHGSSYHCPEILVTHGHVDHIAHFGRYFKEKQVNIYATQTPYNTLLRDGLKPEQLVKIAPGWQKQIAGLKVTAYQGRHCKFDLPLILRTVTRPVFLGHLGQALRLARLMRAYPENEETLFYEIEGEGARVQVMGSMNLDENTQYPTGADVLIFPLQGRSDQDTYALQFVRRLKPKAIWIDHYDNAFPPISDAVDVTGFVRNVEKEFGIPCIPLQEGERRILG